MWHLNELIENPRSNLPEIFVANSLGDFLSHQEDIFPTLSPYSLFVNQAFVSVMSAVKYWKWNSQARLSDKFSTLDVFHHPELPSIVHGSDLERVTLLYCPENKKTTFYAFVLQEITDDPPSHSHLYVPANAQGWRP